MFGVDAGFEESKHPRAKNGEFGKGGAPGPAAGKGGGSGSSGSSPSKPIKHNGFKLTETGNGLVKYDGKGAFGHIKGSIEEAKKKVDEIVESQNKPYTPTKEDEERNAKYKEHVGGLKKTHASNVSAVKSAGWSSAGGKKGPEGHMIFKSPNHKGELMLAAGDWGYSESPSGTFTHKGNNTESLNKFLREKK